MKSIAYAVNSECANPNNHSGPCGGPSDVLGIIILVGLVAIVVGYVAFWLWIRASRRKSRGSGG